MTHCQRISFEMRRGNRTSCLVDRSETRYHCAKAAGIISDPGGDGSEGSEGGRVWIDYSKDEKNKKWAAAPRKPKKKEKTEQEEILELESLCESFESKECGTFDEFPVSQKTIRGLKNSGFKEPTEIQRDAISLALKGKDVLGAAKTGSGKTLAFLIPILECLWKAQWTHLDGLGGLIISPTRELAYQTFQVLKKIGRHHDFSAALIVGGTDWTFEKNRIATTNIVISTPGRLLQHMDENPTFSCDNLKIVVLDEADRILDMGFKKQVNAVVENLPPSRQTLLFSATQTKSVKDLGRLSLVNPVYISVHENAKFSTPENLQQSVIVCDHEKKIDLLYSFLRNHLHKKILVFITTCKQVRFVSELLRHVRPGISILALYGSMNPGKRTAVYNQFCSKESVALLATDIAARGLDFPDVDWVVQLDCPCDAQEYIHRSGRTARYKKKGESLLVLSPAERDGMMESLKENKVPVQEIQVDEQKMESIEKKVDSLCAQFPTLKDFAQKAFVSYAKAIHLMPRKDIFSVDSIHFDELSRSYGMAITPRLRFLRKVNSQKKKTENDCKDASAGPSSSNFATLAGSDDESDGNSSPKERQLLAVKSSDVFNATSKTENTVSDEEEERRFEAALKKKKTLTKIQAAKKMLKRNLQLNKKIVFQEDEIDNEENGKEGGLNMDEAMRDLEEKDKYDKELEKQLRKEKRKAKKRKIQESLEEKKKKKPKKQVRGVAMLPSDEDEDSGDSGPDLSWLPDPDKKRTYESDSALEESDGDGDFRNNHHLADEALKLLG